MCGAHCILNFDENFIYQKWTSFPQINSVEQQHAVIEFSDVENCFVIQDLNTAHGTYVNDCRVQNAAVRLAPRDVIRFGFSGFPYELEIDDEQVRTMQTLSLNPLSHV